MPPVWPGRQTHYHADMRPWYLATLAMCLPLGAQTVKPQEGAPALTAATFAGLWEHVVPEGSELAWQRIGWRGVLADAVQEAQRADKPLLVWAMNGHPLGCT